MSAPASKSNCTTASWLHADAAWSGDAGISINWAFRNHLNLFGAGIDKMQLQLLDSSSNAAITMTAVDPTAGSIVMQFAGTNVVEGVYFLQASYTNTFQDGTVAPGGNVTYTSQQFFLENSIEASTDKCPTSSSSSSTTSASSSITSASSSASGSGSPTGAASPSSPSSGDAHGGSSGGGSSNPPNGSALSSYSPKLGHFLLGVLLYFFL